MSKFLKLGGVTLLLFGLVATLWPLYAGADVEVRPVPAGDRAPFGPLVFTGPLFIPPDGAVVTTSQPTFAWAEGTAVATYTLAITGSVPFTGPGGLALTATIPTTEAVYTSAYVLPDGVYTWTVQGDGGGYVEPPFTFSLQALAWQAYLPIVLKMEGGYDCPEISTAVYERIAFSGPRADHPDYLHADLNLSLRGYSPVSAHLGLVEYSGATDPLAPQLAGLFSDNQAPDVTTAYRVNSWDWGCGLHGCVGPPLTTWDVTLIDLATTPGEPLFIPERGPDIHPDGYKALVLYAEATRLTIVYTDRDSVSEGYAIHLERLCVDPNLLALYQAQTSAAGWHVTGYLPALGNNQSVGVALGDEVGVAIRDSGTFMDPRSRKDWWWQYLPTAIISMEHSPSAAGPQ